MSASQHNVLDLLGITTTAPPAPPVAPAAPRYHRSAVRGDAPAAAFETTGRRRWLLLAAWGAIVTVAIVGIAATALAHPLWLLPALALAYLAENLLFVLGHVGLHAAFIELDEANMATITHHSFLHHYRRPRVYHETWLETRLSYFFCPRKGLLSISTWTYLVAMVSTAGLLALVAPAAGLALLSSLLLARLLQSVVHEWYHHSDRRGFYWAPTYALLWSLERIGILSTRRHRRHHAHHLHNLDAVHHWTDMSVPGLDRLGDALWARAKAVHEPGQQHMLKAVARTVAIWLPLHYGGMALAFWALATLTPG